ncbi:MAG: transposase [Acidobacteriia bacterium]|nr:transposase [Terriglobia bacterium]
MEPKWVPEAVPELLEWAGVTASVQSRAPRWVMEVGGIERLRSIKRAIRYCGLCSAERSSAARKLVAYLLATAREYHRMQLVQDRGQAS